MGKETFNTSGILRNSMDLSGGFIFTRLFVFAIGVITIPILLLASVFISLAVFMIKALFDLFASV